ncbi:MAG: glycosyltransferase family 39 protein [Candidatus Aminicenantales bacterium]
MSYIRNIQILIFEKPRSAKRCSPHYTQTAYLEFYEHPPLAFFLQSFAFKIFGEGRSVEIIYSILLGLAVILLITLVWRQMRQKDEDLSGGWWPALLFALFPMTSWIFTSNMLENTMTVFILLACLWAIMSMSQKKVALLFVYGFLSGASIFCAFLSKGPAGTFPLVAPFFLFIAFKKVTFKKAVLTFLSICVSAALLTSLIILANPEALHFFKNYLHIQVLGSVSGKRELSPSNLTLLRKIVLESLIPLALCFTLHFSRRARFHLKKNRTALFYFLMGLSGSLPLLFIPKQMSWYLFPALPFYAMLYASLFRESAKSLELSLEQKPRTLKKL